MSKSERLRELIAKSAIMLPGVPNAAMARQVERVGFDAVYVSGAGWRMRQLAFPISVC